MVGPHVSPTLQSLSCPRGMWWSHGHTALISVLLNEMCSVGGHQALVLHVIHAVVVVRTHGCTSLYIVRWYQVGLATATATWHVWPVRFCIGVCVLFALAVDNVQRKYGVASGVLHLWVYVGDIKEVVKLIRLLISSLKVCE